MHNVLPTDNEYKQIFCSLSLKKIRNVFSNNKNIPTLKKLSLLAKVTPKRA